jgi:hypothetical protein
MTHINIAMVDLLGSGFENRLLQFRPLLLLSQIIQQRIRHPLIYHYSSALDTYVSRPLKSWTPIRWVLGLGLITEKGTKRAELRLLGHVEMALPLTVVLTNSDVIVDDKRVCAALSPTLQRAKG